jgi:chromosome segregation ATPase
MTTIRIRPRGSLTYHRCIVTPRATRAAGCQRFMSERPLPGLSADMTNHQFLDDIEARISAALMSCQTNTDVFKIYQEAFNAVITKYQDQSPGMLRIKQGYDDLISALTAKSQQGAQHRLVIQQSMSSFGTALYATQSKIDKKRKNFETLIHNSKSLILDLKSEIGELEKQVWDARTQCQIEENASGQELLTRAQYEKKLVKMEASAQKWRELKAELDRDLAAKRQKRVQSKIDLEKTLDGVFSKSRRMSEVSESITRLKREITESDAILTEQKQQIGEIAPQRDALKTALQTLYHEIEERVKEGDEFALTMNVALAGLGVKEQHIEAAVGDTIRQTALLVSFVRGYQDGIDPERFPDLV